LGAKKHDTQCAAPNIRRGVCRRFFPRQNQRVCGVEELLASRFTRRSPATSSGAGAGFSGPVLTERLSSQPGKLCLAVEKREHIGGNAFGAGGHVFPQPADAAWCPIGRFGAASSRTTRSRSTGIWSSWIKPENESSTNHRIGTDDTVHNPPAESCNDESKATGTARHLSPWL
jgi:hypothetical protein